MGLFSKSVVPTSELKLGDYIPKYDEKMNAIIKIGKCLYSGFLPDSALAFGDFSYLKGFHNYYVYTRRKNGVVKRRKTLQVPKLTTEYLTKLIYTEKVKAVLESESMPDIAANLQEYLYEVLDDNDYWNNTSSLTETMFNMGGKVEYPTIKNSKMYINFITADMFVPTEWDNKNILSGVFVQHFMKNDYYYTKLMWVEKKDESYEIRKELFKSKDNVRLGIKVNYSEMFDDEEKYTLNGFKSIPFTYTKPRVKNNQVLQSPLGLPIWFNAIDVIADIDLIFDTKFREVRYGGRQKVIPSYAMKQKIVTNKDGSQEFNAIYDPDDETIQAYNIDPNSKQGIVDLTSPIRDTSFIALLNNSLDIVGVMLGFNTGTFVFNGTSMKTATEIITEKQATYQTKVNQERALEKGHRNLFLSILELALATDLDDRVRTIPDDLQIKVEFDDSIIIDKEKYIDDMVADAEAGRIHDWRPVAERYKLTEEEAKLWVQEATDKKAKEELDFINSIESNTDEEIEEEIED